jgi:hypothetical protein
MLNGFGIGNGMKAARTGDQIDAQVTAARGLLSQATLAANNFDMIEQQLQQMSTMMQQDPSFAMLAMQFNMIQQQIDANQKQIQNSLTQLAPILQEIDNLTNKIQN